MPWRPSASAHISPVGPAPATTTGRTGIIVLSRAPASMRRGPGARGPVSAASLDQLGAGRGLQVLEIDLFQLVLRQVERVENAQRLADIAGAFLGIERAVGREDDILDRIEGEPAHGPGVGAEHGGIDVEILLEVIERPLLQAALERLGIRVRGAGAALGPARA